MCAPTAKHTAWTAHIMKSYMRDKTLVRLEDFRVEVDTNNLYPLLPVARPHLSDVLVERNQHQAAFSPCAHDLSFEH